jgi:hypothetical protein
MRTGGLGPVGFVCCLLFQLLKPFQVKEREGPDDVQSIDGMVVALLF